MDEKPTQAATEADKQALIDLITWYRDEWHKKDFGHTKLIEEVRRATTTDQLSLVERVVDGWLD